MRHALNVVVEEDGENQLDLSCEEEVLHICNQGGEEYPTYIEEKDLSRLA
jgi:hypothetical protein